LTLKEQLEALDHVEKKQNELSVLMKKHREAIVLNHSPVQIGDIVKANQYSYNGRKIKIDTLFMKKVKRPISNGGDYYEFRASGHLITANGIGKARADWAKKVEIGVEDGAV
jgi:hypothetical protein